MAGEVYFSNNEGNNTSSTYNLYVCLRWIIYLSKLHTKRKQHRVDGLLTNDEDVANLSVVEPVLVYVPRRWGRPPGHQDGEGGHRRSVQTGRRGRQVNLNLIKHISV